MPSLASRLYRRVFPEFRPALTLRPSGQRPSGEAGLCIRWLGTAGFLVESGAGAVIIDPYVTRADLGTLIGSRLASNAAAVEAHVPPHLDAVLCGHSHFDHALDAPLVARLCGAKLVGSRTTCAVGRGFGLADSELTLIERHGGQLVAGDIEIRFVHSRHARLALGTVPFPGEVRRARLHEGRIWDYRMGGAFGIFLRAAGVRVYHNGSADLVDAELEGERADVVLVGLAGRQTTRGYLERLLGMLKPAIVVPAHHDAIFTPLEQGVRLLPGIDFAGFVADVARILPRAQVIAPFYGDRVWVSAGAKNAFIASP
jgi:L-ascorbate metabolism protein UlaG (beta-lactamase superfamily)